MKAYERLINYTAYETASDEESTSYPSTASQLVFAAQLVKELESIGLTEIETDEYGYVTATIPSNVDKETPVVAFIAHMDVVSDVEYRGIKTHLVENYDGGDVLLNAEKNIVMKAADYAFLKNYIGKTLLVTDGTTLLGADDKAGIAEIMTAAEKLVSDNGIKHGKIRIAFTPDEEIGKGVDFFNVEKFGADYAYTLDGGAFGEVEYETFNAASAVITVQGVNIHPGSAKGKMKNALLIAGEFMACFPENERPETTEGYEGYYHLNEIKGNVDQTVIKYILRDHDSDKLEAKKAFVLKTAEALNAKYGAGTITAEITDSYRNMKEKILENFHLIETASACVEALGGKAVSVPVRGGTDGCRLSFMGLPCPNLGTGSHNHHGKTEFAIVEDMDKAVELIIKIAEAYAK